MEKLYLFEDQMPPRRISKGWKNIDLKKRLLQIVNDEECDKCGAEVLHSLPRLLFSDERTLAFSSKKTKM